MRLKIEVDGANVFDGTADNFKSDIPLGPGQHILDIQATDANGTPANEQRLLTVPVARFAYLPTIDAFITGFRMQPESGALEELDTNPAPGFGLLAAHSSFLYSSSVKPPAAYGMDSSGSLTPLPLSPTAVPFFRAPAIAVEPDGRFLFTAWFDFVQIAGYKIDSGIASSLPAPSFEGGGGAPQGPTQAGQLILSRDGRFAYWPHMWNLDVLAIDPQSGSMTQIQSLPPRNNEAMTNAALTASGRFLYGGKGAEIWAFKIDLETGKLTSVSETPTLCNCFAPLLATSEAFLVAASSGREGIFLYRIDADTGALTESSHWQRATGSLFPSWVVLEPSGRFLYVGNADDPSFETFAIDPVASTLRHLGTTSTRSFNGPLLFVE